MQVDEDNSEPSTAAAPLKDKVPYEQNIVNIDEEHSLVAVRASGGDSTVAIGPNSLAADVAIGAFEIEDLLVGPVCVQNSYLARSSLPAKETFYDPSTEIASMRLESSKEIAAGPDQFQDASEQLPQADSQTQAQALVLQYAKCTSKAPEYHDIDAEVHVKLQTLSFFGNRPTLAALMAIGSDISIASAAKPPDAPAAAVHHQAAQWASGLEPAQSGLDGGATDPAGKRGALHSIA